VTAPRNRQPATPLDLPSLEPLPTAAERAADLIRDGIFEGKFRPGTPLPETALAQALQVSRNTVREAFRTLVGDHLLSYEVNRGMSVRTLGPADVTDIYRLRRLFELAAVDLLAAGEPLDAAGLTAVVDAAEAAARAADWGAVGTANLRFHEMLVAVHGSARIAEFFRRLMTEMRLGFLAVDDIATFHGAYLSRNREVLDHLVAGEHAKAREALAAYLRDAEADVVAAVAGA
jgi:DNA-binding GntR family transcriptional regulator